MPIKLEIMHPLGLKKIARERINLLAALPASTKDAPHTVINDKNQARQVSREEWIEWRSSYENIAPRIVSTGVILFEPDEIPVAASYASLRFDSKLLKTLGDDNFLSFIHDELQEVIAAKPYIFKLTTFFYGVKRWRFVTLVEYQDVHLQVIRHKSWRAAEQCHRNFTPSHAAIRRLKQFIVAKQQNIVIPDNALRGTNLSHIDLSQQFNNNTIRLVYTEDMILT